ncbi:oxygenase MpaB family protein [Nocardioides sp. MAHUQ-72]|uniref:oxygenase MpaB family protein n=1 Tax=unclassified Nocardioides TaxID=2615069 RepID=UPI00361D60D1
MTPPGKDAVRTARERLGQALFLRVAGPDGAKHRERIHGRPGPRWFEPDSPIARVHGDASMFVGGIRALLLQTLHPAAMRAVSEHSGFRGDMWGRLARTSRFLAVTTFGHAEDAQQAVDVVRAIHERVTGTMDDGTAYAASDPHLLMWVHIAEVDSFLLAHTVYGKEPLDQAGRDTYVAQTAEVARRLGVVDPPTTEAELRAALAAYRPELRGTEDAREAISYLLFKPPLPLAAKAPYGVLVAAAIALMPRWTRKPLRLPYLPVSERTVVRALGAAATGTIRWAMTPPRQVARDGSAATTA